MDLKNVNAFIHVAETNSFTRAAERLEYAQSTITAQIQTLEAEDSGDDRDAAAKRRQSGGKQPSLW